MLALSLSVLGPIEPGIPLRLNPPNVPGRERRTRGTAGADRATLAFLMDSYREEKVRKEKRVVLGLDKKLSPIKVAVLPLLRNRPEIVEMAKKIAHDLRKVMYTVYDDTAGIGRLYRRQDEVGTPYCITVDVDSLEDKKVTVRDRDTMEQDRVSIETIKRFMVEKFEE